MKNAGTLKVTTPTDREIAMTRVFDAPRRLVFDALTKPELVKTWLLGPSFEGLDAEVDPVLGQRTESDVLTIPTPCGPLRVKGLKDFVTVKGSGYFFLPGRKAIRFLSY